MRSRPAHIPTTAPPSIRSTPRRFSRPRGLSGRNLFGYLTAYVQGAGIARALRPHARQRREHRARRLDARLARLARHGAVHQRARRARLLSIRHQRRRLLVLADEARAPVGQARPLRHRPRHKLTRASTVEARGFSPATNSAPCKGLQPRHQRQNAPFPAVSEKDVVCRAALLFCQKPRTSRSRLPSYTFCTHPQMFASRRPG